MKGFLLDIDYETRDGRAVVKLFLKGEEANFIAVDDSFLPYLYALPSGEVEGLVERIREAGNGESRVKDVLLEDKKFFGRDLKALKVVLEHPQDVPRLREIIKNIEGADMVLEHDILFVRRYLIDRDIAPLSWIEVEGEKSNAELRIRKISLAEGKFPELKVLAFDTEVYNPKGAPREKVDPIIMISLASNTGLRKVLTWKKPDRNIDFVEVLENEKAILKRFEEIMRQEDFDILVGYNTDNFDFPYLVERLKKLELVLALGRDGSEVQIKGRRALPEARIKGRAHIDLYPIIRRAVKLSSYVLENVVKEVLGIKKEKIPGDKLWRDWDEGGENLEKLIKYSMEDAEVTLRLAEKFLPLQYELTRIVKQPLHDVSRMTAGQLVEWLLMREASKGSELIPNHPAGEEFIRRTEETYIGGYVREPKKGISEDIAVFDFRSLYPSVIVTHNIDPSTFMRGRNENRVPGLDYCFSKEKKGFIPAILENLIDHRMKMKQRIRQSKDELEKRMLEVQQYALKILANSFYGYMGYPRARWYKKECAESVAAFARMYIQKVMKIAEEEFKLEVVYGDTDSLFVLIGKEKEKALQFLEHVNKTLPGIIELEHEGFYKRGIFVTKKRYALIDEWDKITVKGLEFVRRDWAPIAKRTQQEVLSALLKDASPEKAASIVRKTIEDIRSRNVSMEDITIYTQLTKGISAYKNIEPHVIAAQKLVKRGREVAPGMIISYVITKGTKMISQRAEPVEFVSLQDYDPEYYIENQIMPAVLRIIEAMGYSKDYLKEGIEQESIKKWF
ncbi:MAG: ribonuclease H-like domain-containing protein [Euryarchaeota archaeon]|nr:ribonuclease H-like domain-containing protein [Euryarchaeota archaeon]